MIRSAKALFLTASLGCVLSQTSFAQAQPKASTPSPTPAADSKADAYYHFAMGRLYAEMGQADNSRSEINKAITNYEEALRLAPTESVIFEELSDLYIAVGRLQDAIDKADDMLKQNPDNLGARRMLAHVYMQSISNGRNGINEDALHKAQEQYQKIVTQDPKDAESWVMLGRLNGYLHNTPEAEKSFNNALQIDATNEDALVGLAELYGQMGDSKRAAEKLKAAVEKNPNPRTLFALARAYEDLNDYKDAADTLKRALELGADEDQVVPEYAKALMYSDQADEALKLYQQLSAANPRNPEYQLHMAEIYLSQGETAKARSAINRAKVAAPNDARVRYAEVSVLEAEDKTDQAIAALKSILDDTAKKMYSDDEVKNRDIFLEKLAKLYVKSNQTAQAVETYRQIMTLDSSAGPAVEVAIVEVYRSAKDVAKARAEADAALNKYPKDVGIIAEHATVLADQGKVDEAVKELRNASKTPDLKLEVAIAQLYETAKRYSDMGKALDAAEKLTKSDDQRADIYFMRGAMYEHEKKLDESEAAFRKVLEISPGNPGALNYLGYMLADRNMKLDEAYTMVKKALDQDPTNGAYMDSLAWVYYRQGKLSEAEGLLIRALEKIKDPTVHDHLGDVYFKEGKTPEAVAQWQASLKEYKDGNQADVEPSEMAKVTQKLQSAQAQMAKHDK
ncbi:MAG: tetratricopeptide repeat protein [Bryobacteraceae bacterium]|jgi:tetratricopeptide (TPR) repeat protein